MKDLQTGQGDTPECEALENGEVTDNLTEEELSALKVEAQAAMDFILDNIDPRNEGKFLQFRFSKSYISAIKKGIETLDVSLMEAAVHLRQSMDENGKRELEYLNSELTFLKNGSNYGNYDDSKIQELKDLATGCFNAFSAEGHSGHVYGYHVKFMESIISKAIIEAKGKAVINWYSLGRIEKDIMDRMREGGDKPAFQPSFAAYLIPSDTLRSMTLTEVDLHLLKDMVVSGCSRKPMSPLTLTDEEFSVISNMGSSGIKQNKRNSCIFKDEDKFEGKAYNIEGIIFCSEPTLDSFFTSARSRLVEAEGVDLSSKYCVYLDRDILNKGGEGSTRDDQLYSKASYIPENVPEVGRTVRSCDFKGYQIAAISEDSIELLNVISGETKNLSLEDFYETGTVQGLIYPMYQTIPVPIINED